MSETRDLAKGYKPTELGPLPEEWEVVRLGNLAMKTFGGGTPSTKSPEFWGGPIPWTTTAAIREEDTYLQKFQRGITEEGLLHSSTQVAPEGSVLVGTRVGVGKAVVTKFDVAINQDITAIVTNENVWPEFLALSFKTPELQRWFAENKRGTTIKGVPRSDVLTLRMPFPPLHEQQAIARVLHSVQQAKEATQQVIASARELKKGLMRHLFTYGPVPVEEAERVPLKETEVGPVPKHWDVVTLGEVARVGNGSTPKRTNEAYWVGGKMPWLTSAKVHETVIRQADEHVTERALEECHLPIVPAGSVVVAITGQGKTLGNAALTTFDTCVSQHLAYVRFQVPNIVPEFVLAFLQQRYEDLRRVGFGGGSTKGAMTCRFLKSYLVPLPPISEQEEIACALLAIDEKIAAEENRKRSLEVLFKTLLHDLMTGKLRVEDAEVAR